MTVSCFNISNKCEYFQQTESHLLLSINLCESNERDIIYNCSADFVDQMASNLLSRDIDVASEENTHNVKLNIECRSTTDRPNSLNEWDEHKCLLYSRHVEKHQHTLDND